MCRINHVLPLRPSAAAMLILLLALVIGATVTYAQRACTDDEIWSVFPSSTDLGDVNDQLLTKSGPTLNKDGTRTFSMRWQGAAASRSVSVTVIEYPEPKRAKKKVHEYGFDNMKGQTKPGMMKLGFGDEGYKTDDIRRPYYRVHKGQFAVSYYTSYPGRSGGVPGNQDSTVEKIINRIAALPCLGLTVQPPTPPPPVNNCPEITLTASPPKATLSQTIKLVARATDPEGDPLTMTWSVTDSQGGSLKTAWNGRVITGKAQMTDTVSWKNPPIGQYRILVKVSDGKCGKTKKMATSVLVQAGMKISVATDKKVYSPGETVVIQGSVRDEKGGLGGAHVVIDVAGTLLSTTTDSSGKYKCQFPIPSSGSLINYKVIAKASYSGYPDKSQSTRFTAGGETKVTLYTDKKYYMVGDEAKIYGYVKFGDHAIGAAKVEITLSYPGRKTWEKEVQTNSKGYYESKIRINEESWFQTEPLFINLLTDKPVYERGEAVTISGEIVPNTLSIRVKATKTGFQAGASNKQVKVGKGENPVSEAGKIYLKIITPGGQLPSLKIAPSSEGKFSITPFAGYALGDYSIEAGTKFKTIKISNSIRFKVEISAQATQGQINEILRRYKEKIPHGWIRSDKSVLDQISNVVPARWGILNNLFYGDNGFHCAGYRDKVLYFLDRLRFSRDPKDRALLRGLDYGPIQRGLGVKGSSIIGWLRGRSEHHVVVLYRSGTGPRSGYDGWSYDDTLVLDPWVNQKPEVITMKAFKTNCLEATRKGLCMTCFPDPEYKDYRCSYPLIGSPVYINFECKEWSISRPESPFLGLSRPMAIDHSGLIYIGIMCPVNVLIADSDGRKIGRRENESFVFEIPNSQLILLPDDDGTYSWFFALPEGVYQTSIKGYRSGSFNLLTRGKDGSVRNYGTQPIDQGDEATITLGSFNPSAPLNLPSGEKVYPHELLNHKPEVTLRWQAKDLTEGSPVGFVATVSDQNSQDKLTYQWYLDGQPTGWTGLSPKWRDPRAGAHNVAIVASDGKEKVKKIIAFTVGVATPPSPPPVSSIIDQTLLLDSIPPSPWNQKSVFAPGDVIYVWVESKILNEPHKLEIVWINPYGKEIKREKFDLRGWGSRETFWSELETGSQMMQGRWKIVVLTDGRVDQAIDLLFKP